MSSDTDSVTQWIRDLGTSRHEDASRLLWDRYFAGIARLARSNLCAVVRGPADGEDVALSVFDSFFRGAAEGRFDRLLGRDDLWRLLVTIAARKAHNARRDELRLKRGGVGVARPAGDDVLASLVDAEPSPEFAALLADETRRLLDLLSDESLRVVVRRKLEGYTNEEIARSLDCGVRTVERKLGVIRKQWLAGEDP